MSMTGLPSCPRAKASAAPAYVEIKTLLYSTILYIILVTPQNKCMPDKHSYGLVMRWNPCVVLESLPATKSGAE